MLACDGISVGGLFQWKLTTCDERANSLKTEDYPKLPLFNRKGPNNSTAFLNPVFWLVFDGLSTWRSIPQLYCSVDEMESLADAQFDATPAAMRGAFPALCAVTKISRNFVAYLQVAGLVVVTPYLGGTADPRAAGLAEAHAKVVP